MGAYLYFQEKRLKFVMNNFNTGFLLGFIEEDCVTVVRLFRWK